MTEYLFPIFAIILIVTVPFIVGYALLPYHVEKPLMWWFGLFVVGLFFLSLYVVQIPLYFAQAIGASIVIVSIGNIIREIFLRKHILQSATWNISLSSVIVYGCTTILLLYSFTDIYTNPITGQDGIVTWLGKAKDFYYWNPFVTLRYIRYPGLGSMLWALIMMVYGFHESYGRFVYPVIYVMFFLFLWSSMNVKKYRLFCSLYLMALSFLFFRTSIYSGYQDDFLSITAGLSTALFVFYMFDTKKSYRYLLACFFAGSLGLIKSEGILLGLIIIFNVLVVYFATIKREWKTQSLFFIIGVLIFLFVLGFWTFSISLYRIDPTKIQGDGLTFQGIIGGYKNISRIPIIGSYFYNYFLRNPMYIYITIVSFVVFVVCPYVRKSILFINLIIGIHILSILYVYLTTMTPLVWQLDTSFFRLMDQHATLYMLLAVFCLQVLYPKRKLFI